MRIVIAGAGSVGTYLVERLHVEGHDISLIDTSESVLQGVAANFDIQTVIGSASALKTLDDAGMEDADIFIAATESDETNLISCLLADCHQNEKLRKIARVRELVTDASGLSPRISEVFDQFINPDVETAEVLLSLFEVPGASEMMQFGKNRICVVGTVPEPNAPILGRPLRELPELTQSKGVLVVALIREGHLLIPSGDDSIQVGDELFLSLKPGDFASYCELLGKPPKDVKSAIVFGGTAIGRTVAQGLSKRGVKVKLIEPDVKCCENLAADISNVLVLNGSGTDQELLTEEGVADVDIFVGASEDQEKNILSAILAKKMGASQNAVIVANRSYLKFVSEIGIDIAINPQVAAASKILKFIRKGSVSSIYSTRDDNAEVLEIVAAEGSKLVGIPIKDLSLPGGVIVAAVFNDEKVTIPQGNTVITAGDRVVFFAARNSLGKLQSLIESKRSLF